MSRRLRGLRTMLRVAGAAAIVLAGASLAGCERESKVLKYRPFFTGLGWENTAPPAIGSEMAQLPGSEGGDDRIVIENPDGSVRLISRSVRDLMTHIERTLAEDMDEAFIEQLMSTQTKEYLASQGNTPEDLVADLKLLRRDIAKTFARMPFGGGSPTSVFEKTGPRMYVLRLTGQATRDVKFTKLWVAFEGGQFKFVWLS